MTKIKCSKCGKEKQAGQPRYGKLIEKYGGEEALAKNYICIECRGKANKEAKEEKAKAKQKKE